MGNKILVVDDDADITDFIKLVLEEAGYEVVTAENGRAALKQVIKEKPDLILLDVMMPEMSGWEVCELIKCNEESKNVPVIMITAKSEVQSKVKGMQVGANGYVTKPFEIDDVIEKVRLMLESKNGGTSNEQ